MGTRIGTMGREAGHLPRALLLVALVGLLPGCGYQPLGAGGRPERVPVLQVAAIANDTFKPGIQGTVSAAILRQLRLEGRFRPPQDQPPDLVLAGSVTGYQNDAIAFDSQDVGRRFRVRITLSATLTGQPRGEVRFKEEVVGESFYTTGSGVVNTRAAEDDAALRAAQDLARRLLTRLTEEL